MRINAGIINHPLLSISSNKVHALRCCANFFKL